MAEAGLALQSTLVGGLLLGLTKLLLLCRLCALPFLILVMLPLDSSVVLRPGGRVERIGVQANSVAVLNLLGDLGDGAVLLHEVAEDQEVVAVAEVAHVVFGAEVAIDLVAEVAQQVLVSLLDPLDPGYAFAAEDGLEAPDGAAGS
jgi:hypothetical protein